MEGAKGFDDEGPGRLRQGESQGAAVKQTES
jgi:hypothetical protein